MKIDNAVNEWRKIIGSENVITDSDHVRKCEAATFETTQKIKAILKPSCSEEVQSILQIANQFSISIYPSSRGRNCGYGTRVPYVSESVLLDLSRLDKILDYDEELAFVRIQAGVTQEQLAIFLKSKGDRLMMDPIATFADCSVVANILERGHGLTSYADRIASGSDYEIVLPTGEKLMTGYHSYANARTAGLDRWSPGPAIDGLFSQSNFGVVTAMTIWLIPRPEFTQAIAFTLSSQQKFHSALERLRRFKLDGSIKFGPRFFNEYRLIETFSRYPWEKMSGQTPLSRTCVEEIKAELQIPLWLGLVGFHGSKKQIAADSELVLREIKDIADRILVVDENSGPVKPSDPPFERFANAAYLGMTGRVERVTQRPRWRQKTSPRFDDWSQEECGIIWFPVSTPFRGEDALNAIEIIRQTVTEFGFEPDMSVSAIRQRTLEVNASIVFDRSDLKQNENAIPCANEALSRLAKAGFYPHRLGLATMAAIDRMSDENRLVLTKIKQALDPKNILASGRYVK